MKRVTKSLLNLIELTVIGTAVALLVFVFLAQPLKVTGNSMLPNFTSGEQLIAEKLTVKYNDIKRGDVVIINHPSKKGVLLIKRVVGIPGEEVMLLDGDVYINGTALIESYLPTDTFTKAYGKMLEGERYSLPDKTYLLLGDNRKSSTDSREWGPVAKNNIVGKGLFVYAPINKVRFARR